jgi:hypothetical protein
MIHDVFYFRVVLEFWEFEFEQYVECKDVFRTPDILQVPLCRVGCHEFVPT